MLIPNHDYFLPNVSGICINQVQIRNTEYGSVFPYCRIKFGTLGSHTPNISNMVLYPFNLFKV